MVEMKINSIKLIGIIATISLLCQQAYSLQTKQSKHRGSRNYQNQVESSDLAFLNLGQQKEQNLIQEFNFLDNSPSNSQNISTNGSLQNVTEIQILPKNESLNELELLAKKQGQKNNQTSFTRKTVSLDDFSFYCQDIRTLDEQSQQIEMLELCRICNVSKGMRLKSKYKNLWSNQLLLTDKENSTFYYVYNKLQTLFMNSLDIVYGQNAQQMCFVSNQMNGQYSLKKITKELDGQEFINSDLYYQGQDIIEPKLLALRVDLDLESKQIRQSSYIIQSEMQKVIEYQLQLNQNMSSGNLLNFTLNQQMIDKYVSNSEQFEVVMKGNLSYFDESIKYSYYIPIRIDIDINNKQIKPRISLEPLNSQINILDIIQMLQIDERQLYNLTMPKGLSSVQYLPVNQAQLQFRYVNLKESNILFQKIERAQISYLIPFDFSYMPKIGLSDGSGNIIVDFKNENDTNISIFSLTGITVLDKNQIFGVSMQKTQSQDTYQTQLRSLQNTQIKISYLKQVIFSSFNVKEQNFWPEEDKISMTLLSNIFQLEDKSILIPSSKVFWFPRLMQVWEGFVSIYEQNDAEIHILMANLAGTTLQSTHLVFRGNNAEIAFQKTFNLEKYAYYSELRAFEIENLTFAITNQDIDLSLWSTVQQQNTFAYEQIWIEGTSLTLNLKLKSIEKLTDLFSQSFAKIFLKLIKDQDQQYQFNYGLRMTGNLLNEDQVRLEGNLNKNIKLSENVILEDAKFIMTFDINFLTDKKKKLQSSNKQAQVDSYIEGTIRVQVEPGRYLNFFTKIDSSNEEWIILEGQMSGLYTNVLGVQNLHLSQIKMHGQLDYEGQLKNVSIYGQGIFGQECLDKNIEQGVKIRSQDMLNLLDLVSKDSESPQFTLNSLDNSLRVIMERKLNNQKNEILDLNKNCFLGDIRLQLDLDSFTYTFLKGHLWAKSLRQLLDFVITDKDKYRRVYKNLIQPISELQFEDGIDFSFNPNQRALRYKSQDIPSGFRFQGNIIFLGQKSHTTIDLSTLSKSHNKKLNQSHQFLNIKFELPSFTVGHQNIQIISFQDFYIPISKEEEQRVTREPIQISVNLDIDSEHFVSDIEQISIQANVKALDYLTQAQLVVDNDELSFSTNSLAYPFTGIFPAQISANIDLHNLVDISKASSSINVTFSDTSNSFKELKDKVDKLVYETWILPVSNSLTQYLRRQSEIQSRITLLKTDLCDVRSCVQQQSCLNNPILQCKEYKVIEKCLETQKTCKDMEFDMVCKTFKSDVQLSQEKSTDICQAWSYECSNKNANISFVGEDICTKSEYQFDYNNCIDFTIDCDRGYVQDQYCLAQCQNTKNEYESLERAQKNLQVISDAIMELFGAIHALAQTKNNTSQNLIQITSIEIDQELEKTLLPSEYELTVRYVIVNQLDSPREVTLKDFDFLFVDVAAEKVAQAIRKDLSVLYGLSPAFGDYMQISLQNIEKFMMHNGTQLLTVQEIKQAVLLETERQAGYIDSLKTQKVIKISTPSILQIDNLYGLQQRSEFIQGDKPTSLANSFIKSNKNKYVPSGIESIRYDLGQTNPINQ
eukprot:403336229